MTGIVSPFPIVRPLRSLRLVPCLALALALIAPAMSYAAPARQILILHSYSQEYPWTRGQHDGFIQTLATDPQTEFLVSTEYMDTKRRAYDEAYASELARHLRFKYARGNLAAIYLTDDNALLFVRDHLSRAFPGVPVFFSGVNDYGVRSSLDPALFTGVFERKEFAPNIEWLLGVDRHADDLLFVGDGSNTYRAIESELRDELTPYRLRVTFLAEKRLDRLLARLRGLPGKYLFLTTLGGITAENDQVLPLREIMRSLVGTGRIVIAMEDVYIIEGVLGGYVTSGRKQGEDAARLLLAYQHGTPIVDLPPVLKSPNELIFDDRSLQRHGIDLPYALRSRAVLLNPRPGLYERYESLIVGILIALAVSLLSVVAVSIFVMSRKNRELTLAQNSTKSANALFHQLAEQSRTVHWEIDSEGLYTYVSIVSEAVIGYRPEEIMGKKRFYDLRPEEGREAFRTKALEAFARGEHICNLENTVQTRDGRLIRVSTNGIPSLDANGKIAGYRGSDTDITERKRAEEERRSLEERLNRAEKMEALGVLAGGVAHDLNNVLGVVIGYSELLLDKEDKTSAIRPQLEEIMKGGQRAAAIVQDLLTLARRGVLGRDVINLNTIVADFRKLPEFQNLSAYHPSVRLKYDIEPGLPNISGSSVHLGKTLFNLVSNGCEAMPRGGILTIGTANQYLDKPIEGYDEVRKGDYVVLSVSDMGEGISEADMKRIFEPFYTKKVMGRSGTGLGLAVVWGTVKDHHGYINVQSEEGKGSTFTLYFPVTREKITAGHDPLPISDYMGKGEFILIVDDVKEQRDLAAKMLKKLNYDLASVASGEEAVVFLKDHRCDLLILDMIMAPGMDGLDTYRKVLEISPKQKAIIVSGFSESDRVHAAHALGAGAYVRKPYVMEKLGLAVRKELDRPS